MIAQRHRIIGGLVGLRRKARKHGRKKGGKIGNREIAAVDGGGIRRRNRINEVGSGFNPTHGPRGGVVSARSFLRRVIRPKPPPFFRLRVSNLRRIPAPRAAAHASVLYNSAAARTAAVPRGRRRPPIGGAAPSGGGAASLGKWRDEVRGIIRETV
nr:hypothetical protein Iba_chr15cCG7410 [Ipomoea batatas]